jgi:hypothetical protein
MTETVERVDEMPMKRVESAPMEPSRKRIRIGLALAVVALLAALAGAFGPAQKVRSTYTWPPRALPAGTPERVWYTPLLLVAHRPEAIRASIPCLLPRALSAASSPLTVLATARSPATVGGLAVTRTGNSLTVRVGRTALDRFPARRGRTRDCSYLLELSDGRWHISGGPAGIEHEGALEVMPFVSGLSSGLDLRTGRSLTIGVTTTVHDSQPTARQKIAWIIASLAAIAALLVIALEHGQAPLRVARRSVRAARANAHPADAVVGLVLLGWWVIAPAFYDDGWTIAIVRNLPFSGDFSTYYDPLGANLPLGYWLKWLQHWIGDASSNLLVLRLLPLACLAATWVLCRSILARAATSLGASSVALWALAAAFLVGGLAWGLTLRPEPEVALLVTAVLACTSRFLERQTASALAASGVLVALAISAHPAGIVSLAPILVITPTLFRWARPRVALATTIVAAAGALVVTLGFVGADVEQRRADSGTIRNFGGVATSSWSDELERYRLLHYAPPLQRALVALMILAVLAYLLRPRNPKSSPLLNLPGAALAASFLLLIATPSKWPSHFGVVLGVTAVASAVETARLRESGRRARGWHALPLLVIAATAVAAAVSWSPRGSWNALDLRTLDWSLGFERHVTLSTLAGALPLLLLLAGAAVFALARRDPEGVREAPWRVAQWTAALLAAPLIVYTLAILVADSVKTDSWTLARQNVDTLRGHAGCGLAGEARLQVTSSMRTLRIVPSTAAVTPVPRWVPPAPADGLPRFSFGRVGRSASSPWFELPTSQPVGLFVAGTTRETDSLGLEWGRRRGRRVERLGRDQVPMAALAEAQAGVASWRFLDARQLPTRDPGAEVVRLTLESTSARSPTAAVTAPVTYTDETLLRRLERKATPTLVLPNLVTYIPCATLPRIHDGIAEAPGAIVGFQHAYPVGNGSSAFEGVLDLHRVDRLPVTDSHGGQTEVGVYQVDQRVVGGVRAAPDKTTFAS